MEWLDWNDEAFALARERGCPVVLFVKASWCRWCRELETGPLADPRVVALIEERFVPILVDKDRRPDIDPRYTKGGWPTLAWLEEGGDLLGADNFLDADQLAQRLREIADWYEESPERAREGLMGGEALEQHFDEEVTEQPSKAALGTPKLELSRDVVDRVARTVLEKADPIYGGWGKQHKFPHPEAVDFALIRWTQSGDPEMLDLVRRTLHHVQAGEIHDRVEGGFYRYATQPNWSVPHHEKMLDSNVQRIYAYLEAWQALGEQDYLTTARRALSWVVETLFDERTRAFMGSQDADDEYAKLKTVAAREKRGAPPCDPTIFANWNAMTASTFLKARAALSEHVWAERAVAILDFLHQELWDDRKGMYHYWDGQRHLPGMLGDQAYTLRALVDAVQFAAENRFLDWARDLANLTIETLRAENGGFYDTAHDPRARGGLRRRNRSILENSVIAEALLRLAHLSGESDYADCAREALASFAGDYKRYGHYVAGYARAVDLLYHEPVVVTIVGDRSSQATRDLAQAALRPYVASRIVRTIDPEEDAELLARIGLPKPEDGPRAYVERGRESYAETSDPTSLPALMLRT